MNSEVLVTAILLDQIKQYEPFSHLLRQLKPEHFGEPKYANIWKAAAKLADPAQRGLIDLTELLKDEESSILMVDLVALADDALPVPQFIVEADKVRQAHALRELTIIGQELIKAREQKNPNNILQIITQLEKVHLESTNPTWFNPVDGAALLDEMVEIINRFLILPPHAPEMMALWVMHTHCFNRFSFSPILTLQSPTRGCGKSTALSLIEKLVCQPQSTSNITEAALYRTIHTKKPTILIDEVDSQRPEQKDALRNILNSGFSKGSGGAVRCDGDDHNVVVFNTFCPKAVAGIGEQLHNTTLDRSIVIKMLKPASGQKTEKLRGKIHFSELKSKLTKWALDHFEEFEGIEPVLPEGLSARQEDLWGPLVVIAEMAGGEWLKYAHDAAIGLLPNQDDEKSAALLLLRALNDYFNQEDIDRVRTTELILWINMRDDLPFKDYRHGKGLDSHKLSQILKDFEIRSKTFRLGIGTHKGYMRMDCLSAFERFLKTPDDVVTSNPEMLPIVTDAIAVNT